MSAGFYKNENNFLIYAPNFVYNENYTLRKEEKNDLIWLDVFPIDGWYWFDSKEEAVAALGVDFFKQLDPPLPPINSEPPKREKTPPKYLLDDII